jgi:hypothetical protein
MRNKVFAVQLLLAVFAAAPAPAQEQQGDVESYERARQLEEKDKPELRTRRLPADTFKPSETISEDFPVPFPVDI